MNKFEATRYIIGVFMNPTSDDSQKARELHKMVDKIFNGFTGIEKNNTETGYEYLYYILQNDRKYYFNPCTNIEKEFEEKIRMSTEVINHPKVTDLQSNHHKKVILDCKEILNLIRGDQNANS